MSSPTCQPGKVVARKGMWPHRQLRGWHHLIVTILSHRRDYQMWTQPKDRLASVMTAVTASLPQSSFKPEPLRAKPRHRRIFARRHHKEGWLFYSDAPDKPRKVIRADVIEQVFGEGAYNRLSQRDHWEMIEAGWFEGDDLHMPALMADDTYLVWRAFYSPMSEACGLLADAFADKYGPMPSIISSPPNGLILGVHPSTPRYATARVHTNEDLFRCMFDLEATSPWIRIVLPDEFMPMLARYSDPDMKDDLMWRVHNPKASGGLTMEQKMRRSQEASLRRQQAGSS